jgi:[histone H3]-lysine4 N-trimethyltransferase MLL3
LTSPILELSGMAPPNSNVKKELPSPVDLPKPSQSPTLMQPILLKSFSQTSSLNSGNTTPVPMESPSIEVKKEMDDSSQSESISSDVSMIKTESILMTPTSRDGSMTEIFDGSPAKTAQELADELKKKKRREYQKNRRQMQMSNKEKGSKKPRKLQKNEEDYDSFIDNLMVQIKSLSQMQILEPLLPKNFNVCAIYGSHELNKVNSLKRYNTTSGELSGQFGKGEMANISDFYNTKPFGSLNPKPEKAPVSTQRGFYDQEFPPIKFDDEDSQPNHHTQRSKYDLLAKDRDIDTPDTIVNSSSPECVTVKHSSRFPGLRLIREEEDAEDEEEMTSFIDNRLSPSIPTIITPIPIRLKPGMSLSADKASFSDKENEPNKELGVKSCFGPPATEKDNNNNNVTVTLTLTSSAAEDIMGVLKSLANILNIPAPTAYQIVERTTTPPSQKLGLYRIKGKDGKEGQPVDIQTILNGTAKFCRHCDVVILNNAIKAKANEFPLLVNTELESDEFYFCGSTCYKQFQWRPINMLDDKSLSSSTDDKALESISENISKIEMQTNETESVKSEDVIQKENLKRKRKEMESSDSSKEETQATEKRQKLMRIKTFAANSFPQIHKQKKLSDRDITEMLFRMNITVNSAPKILEDTRKCIFCHQIGDGVADGPSRLINYDVDKWVHLNCALWSDGVYETVNGALMNLEAALQHSLNSQCTICNHLGATVKCFKARCGSIYHLNCAMKDNCVFYKNKTTMCNIHAPKSEKDNELTTLSVQRRVYIERDENRQVASIMHHSDMTNLMRVGSLILLNVGQLLPHQLQTFHTPNYIYPIGYKLIRFFWSMRHPNKRCRYVCTIADVAGRPEFRILVKEVNEEDLELRDESPKKVWQRILDGIAKLRREHQLVQIFPKYISGEDLFGLSEPAVVRILESLPGVETLHDYRFKYGRNPLLELPLAINPSGAARTEPRLKHNLPWKKPHTQRTGSSSQRPTFVPSTSAGEVACPYSKQFVHSKSSQYKKMKLEWRNNVFLARSKIQGLGLYAARDLEKHTMVIEYIGEVIRGELSELREKQYEARVSQIFLCS